jgi:hypothetical protein
MKIYLDSLDTYYSIKHEQEKPKQNKDKTIGKISLILIIAYIAYLISGWMLTN